AEWFTIGAGGWVPLKLLDGAHKAKTRRGQLGKLVVQLGAPGKLAGRDNQRHNRPEGFRGQAATRSRLALKSRLLRAPTICSATWPLAKTSSVGMARMPYSAANACCS